MKRLILIALLFLMSTLASAVSIHKNEISYWSLWTGDQGISHQSLCAINTLTLQQFSVKGSPEWVSNDDMQTSRYVLNIMPSHWMGTWHKSPKAQWVIPVEGKWYIESMDGNRREYGPGELSFGYDISAKKVNHRVGHLSGAVGNKPAKVIVIQVATLPKHIADTRCMAGGNFVR